MIRILVVDDDSNQRKALLRYLTSEKYVVEDVSSGEEAVERIKSSDFDCVLLDQVMPNMSGIDVLVEIKKMKPTIQVIMLTGSATIDGAVESIKKGASNYLSKPFHTDKLIFCIQRSLEELKSKRISSMVDMDVTFGSMSHEIRRSIIALLQQHKKMHLMEMVRSLGIEDHTKVIFHTRILKESGFIRQEQDKSYLLTTDGAKIIRCLASIDNRILAYPELI
jgi:DNA-binding response OmpR family regulator